MNNSLCFILVFILLLEIHEYDMNKKTKTNRNGNISGIWNMFVSQNIYNIRKNQII